MENRPIQIIGGGLAGCEAALTLAKHGHQVELWEMRPSVPTPAHSTDRLAELVCSNSFKGLGLASAHGLAKEELSILGSSLLPLAFQARVPAGESLAIDRDRFSHLVESALEAMPNVTIRREEATSIDPDRWTLVAAGPLASDAIHARLAELVGGSRMSFFDAIAPIVAADSLDWDQCWKANRWDKGDGADFINCPLDRPTYEAFVAGLVEADRVEPKPFEPKELFEGCLPIEEMARRGLETLRHGPMRPIGLDNPKTGRRPWAALQLRAENDAGTLYNLVGCQTRLKWPEQKRLFSMIPALANAEFVRLGSMHRNSFVESPAVLARDFSLGAHPNVFLAGQITGAEGYTEALATGWYAATQMHHRIRSGTPRPLPDQTALGSLVRFLTTPRGPEAPGFQPMNMNFGLLPEPTFPQGSRKKDKGLRKSLQAQAALVAAQEWVAGA
ncbi:MAG TPA: methylenetetrahydrofolate--tRNA-(uracil(54)-C(5))-methyltransferase (FADH(2)-oxidizing) TrmFO [Fibrobacteria bacterium]|nr:methylenetetrahydrofolate--tRNA-(uracil(54)-C(5))-methyltransferase (FADH(2)-oxidizing) TrmFO [Fibrobacteria bacterium]HOX52986.1 methylenetetrahydrofolate--tRNA-(uracil(54)-C(5))-methyltransferase (FADH(2)-oxidizing) TrmFO [Fibrobacteria bacterium]